jgi:hypothetical protein
VPPRPGEPFLFSVFEFDDPGGVRPPPASFSEIPGWFNRWDFVAGQGWAASFLEEGLIALHNVQAIGWNAARLLDQVLRWEMGPGESVAGLTLLRCTRAADDLTPSATPAPADEERGVRYKLFVDPYQDVCSFHPFAGCPLAVTVLVPLPWALGQDPGYGVCLRNPLGEWLYPGEVYHQAKLGRRGFRLLSQEAVSVRAAF